MHWQKITIIGLGFVGSSLGLAVGKRRLATKTDGLVRRPELIEQVERRFVVNHATVNLHRAVENADLVVLCTFISKMSDLVRRMLPALKPGAVVTDVGSIKRPVVRDLEPMLEEAGARFVGGHPLLEPPHVLRTPGADLFVGAEVFVTPTRRTNPAALRDVEAFWRALGASVSRISAARHDVLVSRTRQLPHALAALEINSLLNPRLYHATGPLCTTAFRDATRLAANSVEMWRDLALANADNLAHVLGQLAGDLQALQKAVADRDEKTILKVLEMARDRRERWDRDRGR